jgi:hypothetical protein
MTDVGGADVLAAACLDFLSAAADADWDGRVSR